MAADRGQEPEVPVVRAKARYVRVAPRKARLVADLGAVSQRIRTVRDSIATGAWEGPRILTAGLWVGAKGGVCEFGGIGVAGGPDAFRARVRENLSAHADLIKACVTSWPAVAWTYPDSAELGPEQLGAIVDEAHRAGRAVVAHAISREGVRRAAAAGVDGLAHAAYIDDTLAAVMRDQGIWLIPTLASLARSDTSAPAARGLREAVVRLARQGVTVVYGTDGGVLPHGRNAEEALALAKAGLSASAILRAATANAARALGLADSGAHVGLIMDAGQPTWLLADWVRDRQVMTLEEAVRRLQHRKVSEYSFRHALFQRYLYDHIDEAQKSHLHLRAGEVLPNWSGNLYCHVMELCFEPSQANPHRIAGFATDLGHEESCGATPHNGFLSVAQRRKLGIKLHAACNSGDTAGGKAAAGVGDGEVGDVEAFALEQRGQGELAAPAFAVFGHGHANGLELAFVTPEAGQRRGDVLHDVPDAELLGEHRGEADGVSRRVALRHEETDDALLSQCARAERRDDGAVDPARDPHDRAPPLQGAEHLLPDRPSDLLRDPGRIDTHDIAREHGDS